MQLTTTRKGRAARIGFWLGALALAWAAAAGPAAAAEAVVAGVIIAAKGKPLLRKAGKKEFVDLKLNAFVNEGDTIKTGADDRVAVAFIGGAEVRLAGSSSFLVESGGGQKPTSLSTDWGQAWTRLLHGKAGLNVRTPNATCAVRGTEADVESRDRLTVKVYEGHVDVFNAKGRQALKAGQMTWVSSPQAAPLAPQKLDKQDRGDWQNGAAPNSSLSVQQQIERLNAEGEKNRTVELEVSKDGKKKKVRIPIHKK